MQQNCYVSSIGIDNRYKAKQIKCNAVTPFTMTINYTHFYYFVKLHKIWFENHKFL